ncbi:MAG: hypothetical protein ACREPD_06180 [Stenotrophomonas sp.]|uniref:hypothetical protein n=1 Tax=Stenotrophomonas sp. TaxID=69392 RepID=UPI003D6D5836
MNNTPFTDDQRSEVQRRIIAEVSAQGGMITASQLREVLDDVPAGERAQAVVALQQQRQLETTGNGAHAVHALVRLSSSSPVAHVAPFEHAELSAAKSAPPSLLQRFGVAAVLSVDCGTPVGRKNDPLALRNRINAISQDLDEALVDACSIELPHTAIQRLLEASRATRAAADSVSN